MRGRPLHGIPIVLKDNYDTFDLPTTAGSQMLEGSIPPERRLRRQKAARRRRHHSRQGQSQRIRRWRRQRRRGDRSRGPEGRRGAERFQLDGPADANPHDLTRGPSGSSGGTGASIAAAFAQFGLGTDTGGSVRGPSSANGIVGLKPTHGLLSRDGIVPLALTFDTGGPMARSVYDVAVALGVMTGVDPGDAATKKSEGKFESDYTQVSESGLAQGRAHRHRARFHGQGLRTSTGSSKRPSRR